MAIFGIFKSKPKEVKKGKSKTAKNKASTKKKDTKSSKPLKAKKVVKKTAKKGLAVKKKPGLVKSKTKIKPKEIGRVIHYFGKISVGIIKLKAPLKVGDKIHIKGANDDFKQTVKSMQAYHQSIDKGKRGDEIGIKVSKKVHENDRVYIVNP